MLNMKSKAQQREMFALIERWHESDMGQAEFCREHGLPRSRFYYWLKRYREKAPPGGFAEVRVSGPETGQNVDGEIKIHFPNGVMLRLPMTVNPATVRMLIGV